MPIRLRLTLLFAVGMAAAAAIGGVVFVTELSGGLRSSLETSLETRATAISQQIPVGQGTGGGTGSQGTGGGAGVQDLGQPLAPGGETDTEDLTQVLTPSGRIVDALGPGTATPLLDAAQIASARRNPLVIQRTIAHQAHPFLLLATTLGDQGPLVVVVGSSLATVDEAINRVVTAIVVGGSLGVLVAAMAAWLLAGGALRPVERMRRQAAELSELDSDTTLAVPRSRDEVAALARTLNSLLERLHGALSRQRGFVSAAGHELRTPLAILKSELELAGRPTRNREELVQAVGLAAEETDRLIRLADDLLVLSRGDERALGVVRAPTDLTAAVRRYADAFVTRAEDVAVDIQVDAPTALVASVDEARFRQIVENLLDNALRYAPARSTVGLILRRAGPEAVLEVLDHGPGFPAEFLPRAFERFSRSDNSRNREGGGTGLGLAIVKSLAESHGGSAKAANRPGGGAVVSVVIPVDSEATPSAPEETVLARGDRYGQVP